MSADNTAKKNRKLKLAGVGVLVILLAVVGGPFVYIHFVESKAPAPLTLSDVSTSSTTVSGSTATTAASTTPVSTDGTWKVSSGSQAGYRVSETLFGQSTTAVGRTNDVTGSMTITGNSVTDASYVVQLANVKSDQGNRDNQFKTRIMDVADYPTATFKLTSPIDLGTIPADGSTITAKGTGTFTLHGTTKTVTIDLSAKKSGSTISVSSSVPITFADYNIPNPTFGPAQVGGTGTIEVLLNLTK